MIVYSLVRKNDGVEIQSWPDVPGRINLPGLVVVMGADVGWENDEYRLDQKTVADPEPQPAPRRLVLKSTILDRLTDQQVEDAVALMRQKQLERWRCPDKPGVYFDDPETLAVLNAVGADPAVVLAE